MLKNRLLAIVVLGLALGGLAAPGQSRLPPTCGTQSSMVFFGSNTAALTSTAITTTNAYVLTAWRADGGPILLEGHADGAEAIAGRGNLGELRAKAIRDWLVWRRG